MPNAPQLPPRPAATASASPRRRTTTERGYGTGHQKIRARLKALHPVCQWCELRWSEHLHHIDRDTFNRAPGNLVMLCVPCHDRAHAGT